MIVKAVNYSSQILIELTVNYEYDFWYEFSSEKKNTPCVCKLYQPWKAQLPNSHGSWDNPIEVNESCMYPRCKVFKNNLLGFNPLLLNQAKSGLSQWFLNLLSNQAKHTSLAWLAWFDRRLKNHSLLTRVLGTHFNQKDRTKTTMRTSKRLV